MNFTVDSKVTNMRLYGVVNRSDTRITRDEFVQTAGNVVSGATEILDNENFDDWAFFSALQDAIWTCLGQAWIPVGSSCGVS